LSLAIGEVWTFEDENRLRSSFLRFKYPKKYFPTKNQPISQRQPTPAIIMKISMKRLIWLNFTLFGDYNFPY